MEDKITIDEALTPEGNLIVKDNNDIIIDIKEYTTLRNLVMTMLDASEGLSIKHRRQFNLNFNKKNKLNFIKDLGDIPGLIVPSRESKEGYISYIGPNVTRVYLKES